MWCQSPSGERWRCFGDGRLPEKSIDATSTTSALIQCQKALEQSVKEVHDAYTSKQIIPEEQFGAWHHAPILKTISTLSENHQPLLIVQGNTIQYRTGGAKSTSYKTIEGQQDWIVFYKENYSRVDDQIRLWLRQNVPWIAAYV